MSSTGSVSQWIKRLQAGDHAAAQQLWERYFSRLVRLARSKLQSVPRRAADEEDVALSAFNSFCRGAERGQFAELCGRDSLWRLLVVITGRKVFQLRAREGRQKRGGRAAGQGLPDSLKEERDLEEIVDREPTPEFAAQVADECRRLLQCLNDDQLQSVALWKMEAYTNEEIAAMLGCSLRSVERKLRVIRALWGDGEPV